MSLTLGPIQLPLYNQLHYKSTVPYSQGRVDDLYKRLTGVSQFSRHTPASSDSPSDPRWSSNPDQTAGQAEETQMSSYGSATQLPHDQNQQQHADKHSRSPKKNVLPPIVSPTSASKMHQQNERSPTTSLNLQAVRTSDDQRGPRLLGVQSILNPSHGEDDLRTSRRRSAIEMESGARPTFANPTVSAAMSMPSAPRRILTPISPRLHRATSYGRITGTIDATERPFLSDVSRHTTPEQPSIVPLQYVAQHQASSMPHQSPFLAPAAPTPPLIHPPLRRASVSVVGSTRPSPSPSFADSYSGVSGQPSPILQHPAARQPGPTPPGSMQMTPSPSLVPTGAVPPGSLDNQQDFHQPVVSSGQNYQILTVDTSQGHMQLAVEVQAASRMADEKRKRNAGASARFRARRKEKERDAAQKISSLELELAYAQEDSRHYRAERDFLADIIARHVPQYESHLKNRPTSPRHKRAHHLPHRALATSIDSPSSTVDSEQYDEEPPSSRRRTESYSHSAAAPAPVQLQQYPASPYNSYAAAHPQLPPLQPHGNVQYSPTGSVVSIPPPPLIARPPASHEAGRSDRAYDSRTWPRPPSGEQHR